MSMTTSPDAETVDGKWSMPRGAGPAFFSPTRLYCEPWHGHSNHWLLLHSGTRQPRCGHFWYERDRDPARMPTRAMRTPGTPPRPSAAPRRVHGDPRTGARERRRSRVAGRMLAMMSSSLPTFDLAAEPAACRSATGRRRTPRRRTSPRPAPISVTVARLKNWRRLTPMASGSGGVHPTSVGSTRHGDGSVLAGGDAGALDLRAGRGVDDRLVDLGVACRG